MKIISSLFLIVLFVCTNTYGQISGKINDSQGEVIPFANILLLAHSDSSLVKGTLSDESGQFVFSEISSGVYFIRIQFVGYQTLDLKQFQWNSSEGQKDLGTKTLEEDVAQMDAIVIQATKPLIKQEIDRMVINVENSIMTKGSTALQVLERSPGIYIDRRNNDITLNGKSGVMIMFNGKLLRLPVSEIVNMLNGMNADNVEKVEIFSTPPAKYDAEGSGGLINIALKTNDQIGTNGSVSLTGGYGWAEKSIASLNINHSNSRLNFYGTYSFSHDRSFYDWDATARSFVPLFNFQTETYFLSEIRLNQNSHNAIFGLDYDLNNQTTIGANLTFSHSLVNQDIANRGEYFFPPDSLLAMNINLGGQNKWNNLISNIYLEKQLGKGKQLNVDLDYLYYQNESPYQVNNTFFNDNEDEVSPSGELSSLQRGSSDMAIHIGAAKLDYSQQINDQLKLETGVKATYSESGNIGQLERYLDGQWLNNGAPSSDVNMTERIGALYASFNMQLSPTFNMIVGARYEYWDRRIQEENNEIQQQLGRFFPTIFISKKLSEKSDLQLAYSKRTSRPAYNDMSSYVRYNDPVSVFTGNPLLQPTITHNLRLGYNIDSYVFALSFDRDENSIVRFQLTDNPAGDLIYVSPQNVNYQNSLNLQANIPLKIAKWWDVNVGATGNLRQFKLTYPKNDVNKTFVTYNLNANHIFTLPEDFSIELSGWYLGSYFNGTVKNNGFGMLNLGVKKQFKNSSLQFSITDLFKSMQIDSYYGRLTEEPFALTSEVHYEAESAKSRIFRLTYSVSFGNTQLKEKKNRNSAAKEEKERIRQE